MQTKDWDGEDRRDHATRNENLVESVVCAVRSEFASLGVPEQMHREHHTFINEWIADAKRRRERAEKIKTQVGGWAVVSLLSGIGTGAYKIVTYLQDHLK